MKAKQHPFPGVPLLTNDPHFSIWDLGPALNAEETKHWLGVEKCLRNTIKVDGVPMRWTGRMGRRPMEQVAVNVTPLTSEYVFEELGVRLTARFTSPLLIDDFDIMSTPISFIDMEVEYIDGKEHEVELVVSANDSFVCDGGIRSETIRRFFEDEGLHFGYMGQKRQKPLSATGDHVTIDWGYLWFCGDGDSLVWEDPVYVERRLCWKKTFQKPGKATLLVGYDDIAALNYFGEILPTYYARNGKTIVQALKEFHARHDEIMTRCKEFDEKLTREAMEIGGQDYVNIVTASYRQSIAGHKLVQDREGNLLFISKENDSNACAATVDVSYAGIAMYLYYSPELVRAMLRPCLKFARMPVWCYDFSPHDVGRYPICTGQYYASVSRVDTAAEGMYQLPLYLYPADPSLYHFSKQLPVEECANMILMLAGAAYVDGDYSMCEKELDLLKKWSQYLIKYGKDPEEQVCTDDFTGPLAHNANLAAKAIMGLAALSHILENLGKKDEAKEYWEKAEEYADHWLKTAFNGEHSYLTLDKIGWGIKYNLVWDKLFGWNLLPDEFYKKEMASYVPRINEYGLPMDQRANYTKPEWSMYVTAIMLAVGEEEGMKKMFRAMAKFLAETPNRVPFSDLYDTVTGYDERFVARTVSGGTFMPLVMKKWQERRK